MEIANRERAVADLKTKVVDYQARLNQEPIREQQLSDLTRGYEQSKANYDELLKKKNESAMATSMELLQQGERFRIIDPPSLPVKPEFPNRLKFCGIGLGIGLALGVVVAGGLEMMDDRIYDEKELQETVAGRGDLGNSSDRRSRGRATGAPDPMDRMGDSGSGICYDFGRNRIQLPARLGNSPCINPFTA